MKGENNQTGASSTTNSKTLVSRRSVLKSSGGALVAPAVFVGNSKTGSGSGISSPGDTIELPRKFNGDQVTEWMTVPKAWYEQKEHVSDLLPEFGKEYGHIDGVKCAGKRISKEEFGGKQGFDIYVGVSSSDLQYKIPGEFEGQQVHTEILNPQDQGYDPYKCTPGSCSNTDPCYYGCDYDKMPGGVVIQVGGTSTVRVTKDDIDYMMTAGHVVANDRDPCDGDNIGHGVLQYSRDLGDVEYMADVLDVALVSNKNQNNIDLTGDVADEDLGDVYIWDHYSKSGLDDLIERETTVYHTGTATGTRSGVLKGSEHHDYDGFDACKSFNHSGIRGKIWGAAGDSGAPIYTRDDGTGVGTLCGMRNQGDNDTGFDECNCQDIEENIYGASAYSIKDKWSSITFGYQ